MVRKSNSLLPVESQIVGDQCESCLRLKNTIPISDLAHEILISITKLCIILRDHDRGLTCRCFYRAMKIIPDQLPFPMLSITRFPLQMGKKKLKTTLPSVRVIVCSRVPRLIPRRKMLRWHHLSLEGCVW